MSRKIIALLLLTNALLFATRCNANTPSPTDTPIVAPTPAPSETRVPAPTTTNVPTTTPTQTPIPTATPLYQDKVGSIERDIMYCTADKIALKLDLYFPKKSDGKPFPVAVNVHGGSWSFGDKLSSDSAADIPELLERGYAVAALNYRLAPASKFPAQIEDVKCAIRFLRARATTFHLDPKHIGTWGCSAGGHLAALLGVTDATNVFDGKGEYGDQSSRVQVVATVSAPMDITLYDVVTRADMLQRVFGETTGINPALVRASPITYVSKDAPPFLILQGDKDNLVPLKHGEKMHEKLNALGVPAKLVTVKNGHHCFPAQPSMSPSREEISKMIADFFDQKLR